MGSLYISGTDVVLIEGGVQSISENESVDFLGRKCLVSLGCEGKLSCMVLRGRGGSNAAELPDLGQMK